MRAKMSLTAVLVAVGGAIWALTPLRSPIFGAGSEPDQGVLIFRGYNLLVVVVVSLMTLGLLVLRKQRRAGKSRTFAAGWWTVLAGHVLLLAGSLPAVLFGGQQRDVVMAAQDIGFLGAVVAAVGALPLGISALRHDYTPRPAAVLFIAALPLGVLGIVLLEGLGVPEDYLGLPLTGLYGGVWVVLGYSWGRGDQPGSHANRFGSRDRTSANAHTADRLAGDQIAERSSEAADSTVRSDGSRGRAGVAVTPTSPRAEWCTVGGWGVDALLGADARWTMRSLGSRLGVR